MCSYSAPQRTFPSAACLGPSASANLTVTLTAGKDARFTLMMRIPEVCARKGEGVTAFPRRIVTTSGHPTSQFSDHGCLCPSWLHPPLHRMVRPEAPAVNLT